MKKIVIVLAIITTLLVIKKKKKIVIPKEAIRFRVVANSNKEEDQTLKKKIVNNLNSEIRKLTVSSSSINLARYSYVTFAPFLNKLNIKSSNSWYFCKSWDK